MKTVPLPIDLIAGLPRPLANGVMATLTAKVVSRRVGQLRLGTFLQIKLRSFGQVGQGFPTVSRGDARQPPLSAVVITASQDHRHPGLHEVHQSVFLIDAA